jgi:hypothetical protein
MTTCPNRGQLEHLLDNRLVDTELDELEQHVQGCSTCQQTTDELTNAANCEIERGRRDVITCAGSEPGMEDDPLRLTAGSTSEADCRVWRGMPSVAGY